jgi:two-component system phosphate regulon response regulator PhoB
MADRPLVVEDELDLAVPLQHLLRGVGLETELVTTGLAALEHARAHPPRLILLDLMLPDLSGVEVCRRLRSHPATAQCAVLVVSARTDEYDKVLAFESGADDYLTKPFSARELELRVRALLRRTERPRELASPSPSPLRFGELALDPKSHQASWQGTPLELTVVEFKMLVAFLERKGRALTRDEVCLATWGASHAISERAVDTNVKRLRRKLREAGVFLETVRGVGYRWAPEPFRPDTSAEEPEEQD